MGQLLRRASRILGQHQQCSRWASLKQILGDETDKRYDASAHLAPPNLYCDQRYQTQTRRECRQDVMILRIIKISGFKCFGSFWVLFFGVGSKDGEKTKDWGSTFLKYTNNDVGLHLFPAINRMMTCSYYSIEPLSLNHFIPEIVLRN